MTGGLSVRFTLLASACLTASLAVGTLPVAALAQDCSVCGTPTSCTLMEQTRLRLRKLDDGPGNERLLFRSSFTIPDGSQIDLVQTGIRLVVTDGLGVATMDVVIPPGQFNPATGEGWIVNGPSTTWNYRNRNGTAGGVKKVQVKRRGFGSGDMKIVAFGQDMTFGVPERPVTVTTVLTSADTTSTFCSDVVYPDERCRYRNQDNKLLCNL